MTASYSSMQFHISVTTSLHDRGGIIIIPSFTEKTATKTHRGEVSLERKNVRLEPGCNEYHHNVIFMFSSVYAFIYPNATNFRKIEGFSKVYRQLLLDLFSSITFLWPQCNGPGQARNREIQPIIPLCCAAVTCSSQPWWRNLLGLERV